jgi:hypothetical protein
METIENNIKEYFTYEECEFIMKFSKKWKYQTAANNRIRINRIRQILHILLKDLIETDKIAYIYLKMFILNYRIRLFKIFFP